MDLEEAIRTRRTHKAYGAEPLSRAEVEALVELARWAPNHHLTEPWRFRLVGPAALAALKSASPPEAAGKLDRAPTLVVVSCVLDSDDRVHLEDRDATAAAAYGLLLAAHARGWAAYWRTPAVLLQAPGREAVGLGLDEVALGLLHLGPVRQEVRVPPRRAVGDVLRVLE